MNDLPMVEHRALVPEKFVALGASSFGRIVGHLLGLERALLLLVDGLLDRVLLEKERKTKLKQELIPVLILLQLHD